MLTRAAAGAAAALLLLTACNSTPGVNRRPQTGTATAQLVNGVQEVTIEATDTYRFVPSTIVVHPGEVRIVLKNVGTGAPHNWSLSGFPADFVPLAAAKQTQTATFMAPAPGRYTFVCTIHVQQGQTGTMIVEAN